MKPQIPEASENELKDEYGKRKEGYSNSIGQTQAANRGEYPLATTLDDVKIRMANQEDVEYKEYLLQANDNQRLQSISETSDLKDRNEGNQMGLGTNE